MDIKEFSAKLAEATKELSLEERQALMKMFASVSDEVKKDDVVTEILVSDEGTEIPNGITKRLFCGQNASVIAVKQRRW